jgi:flagellar basal-body rod protein FlgG
MLRALHIASTGMDAQQRKMDVTSNNLANVNTTAFKRGRAEFQDLLYQTIKAPGTATGQGTNSPSGIQVGLGVRHVSTSRDFTQGTMNNTGNALDIAIEGDGFFQVTQPNGEVAFSRAGNFTSDNQGRLVNPDGLPLEPQVVVPPDTLSVTIAADGIVSVLQAGQTQATELGQIQLARFINPGGMRALGRNLFQQTNASGQAVVGNPGGTGIGTLAQGFLEGGNVNVVEEMVSLIVGQRTYEANSKVISASDEMLRSAVQLR